MKVKEIMERAGTNKTGIAIAYIKDALDEINMLTETNVETARIDINEDQRYYDLPKGAVKIIDIRCKNHLNSKDQYRSIPRATFKPPTEDSDGI
jgi:hypothetical protein